MKNIPRLLPLVGVAMVGVLSLNALSGAQSLPDLFSGARAFAEEAAKGVAPAKDAAATVPNLPPAAKPAAVCAPTAAELAKEAGLSPAELQVLQSLGARRGQLDKREQDLDVQLALMAAAEAKLDAKIQALNGMKGDIAKLMVDADEKEQAEIDRLVKVFELMKPKDAAPRMVLLDDSVRLPVASRMKERALSPIIANMPPAEAKKLTEALAARFAEVKKVAAAAQAAAGPLPAAPRPARQAAAPAPKAAAPPAKAG